MMQEADYGHQEPVFWQQGKEATLEARLKNPTAKPSMETVHKLILDLTERASNIEDMAREQANILFGHEEAVQLGSKTLEPSPPDNLYSRLLYINRILLSIHYHLSRFNP